MSGAHLVSTPAVSLSRKKRERLGSLLLVPNAQQRLGQLVESARHRAPLPDALRIEEHRVQGCMVRTWFVPEFRGGMCWFQCDSDAVMIKACLGLLCDVYSGYPPGEIVADDGDLLVQAGVLHQLAENRQRTIARVARQIHEFASAHLSLPAVRHTAAALDLH